MIRDRLVLAAVALAATFAVSVVHLLGSVLDVPLTGRPDRVTVLMDRTGGLFEGSPVTYRGVRVGTVAEVSVEGDGARAEITLRDGVEVPRGAPARVRSLSPVGEQYLDFAPRAAGGPHLVDGDVVEASAVDLPVSVATAAGQVDALLDRVPERDLRAVLRELDAGLRGSGDDLERLLVSSDRLVASLDEAWPETERLLRNGRDVGRVLEGRRGELAGFARDARDLAAFLRGFDPEFRRILRRSPRDFDRVGRLVGDLRELAPPLLEALVRLTDLTWRREPHLRALVAELAPSARAFASAFRGGWLHVDLALAGQRQCTYDTERREPTAPRRALDREGRCSLTDRVWRGAEHAPPPLDR